MADPSVIDSPEPPRPVRGYVIETARPLSQSALWKVQDGYYHGTGITAWSSGDVPHLLTSGPMIARAYARLIEGFIEDCRAGRLGAVDPDEPVYVVELGAGTGRLCFEVLHALDVGALEPFRVVYVLTDQVEANVAFWPTQEKLAPLMRSGRADYARFVAGRDETVRLASGTELAAGSMANPLIVAANYLFDVIPQDLYAAVDGELYEEHVALAAREPGLEVTSPEYFRQVFVAPHRVAAAPDRYGDELDELVAAAGRRYDGGEHRFLFPSEGIRALKSLGAIANGRLLVLVGERPGDLPDQIPERSTVEEAIANDPEVAPGPASIEVGELEAIRPGALLAMGIHGESMSLPVEVDLLAASLAHLGVNLYLPPAAPAGLLVAAIVAGAASSPAVAASFARAVADLGPEDVYLTVKTAVEHLGDDVALAMLLAVLRTSGYDPYLFRQVYPSLEHKMRDADPDGAEEAERVLDRIYEHDYPLDDLSELSYPIAVLLAQAERFERALWYFERSEDRHGARAATSYNIALCHLHLDRVDEALDVLNEALALDAGYEAAALLRDSVLEERGRRTEGAG